MVSISKKIWLIWLVVLSLVLVACERPFQPSNDVPAGVTPTVATDTSGQPAEGGETPAEGGTDTGAEQPAEGNETPAEGSTDAGAEQPAESSETPAETTANPTVHIVVAGDTLYKIGLKYGISWKVLAEFNNLANTARDSRSKLSNLGNAAFLGQKPLINPPVT